jgi:hypothetical protein
MCSAGVRIALVRASAGGLALQLHDPQAEQAQGDRGHAGPGPQPVDAVAQHQQDDEGDRPDADPGQHHAHGVDLERRWGLLEGGLPAGNWHVQTLEAHR